MFYLVDEIFQGMLWGCEVFANPAEAFRQACHAFARLLNGQGKIKVVDHDEIEIPHSSSLAFLERGKPVGIVQDGSENAVWIRVRKI